MSMRLTPVLAWSVTCGVLVALLVFSGTAQESPRTGDSPLAAIQFRDVTATSGIAFTLQNNPTPEKHLIETMPGGLAVFDYDGDGRSDIYFTNGAEIPSLRKTSPKFHNRLYRNAGELRFEDVTEAAGVAGTGYSMGTAAADYDNDGDVDLFVAGVGENLVYRNDGDGKFTEVSTAIGIQDEIWSVAGAWLDYDNDGWLDLFIVNYAHWTASYDRFCGDEPKQVRVYCHPKFFAGLPNKLYRNLRDGTFADVSERAGIQGHIGRGMSAASADYDRDGFIDIFVTNDHMPNFLFHNRGDGTFEEVGLVAGAALLDHGRPVSAMGVDWRDYDNDGLPDLAITALAGETFPLFRNLGGGEFADATHPSGLARAALKLSGWGVVFADLDNDGWKDLVTANSHVNDRVELFEAAVYKQANSVFLNTADGKFRDVSETAGAPFQRRAAHRGLVAADLDGDGRLDLVVTALGEPAAILRNVTPASHHWLRVKLRGTRSNRDGLGARVQIGRQTDTNTSSLGYASSRLTGLHFGLGEHEAVPPIRITWPDGKVQEVAATQADRVTQVTEPLDSSR